MSSTNNLFVNNALHYIEPAKIRNSEPSNFRLKRKANGELVLMGGFNW